MKKIYAIIILILIFIPFILADGGIIIYDIDMYDRGMWGMFDEEQQLCAINYKNGFQNMILTVDTGEELRGEKAAWIFPVPAKPEKTVINIIKGFPTLYGYDIEKKAGDSIFETSLAIMATQIYPFPLYLISTIGFFGTVKSGVFELGAFEEIIVHERVEKMGLTTELISTTDAQSFSNYLISKNLELPNNFKSILDEYIGEEYLFVISWISDIQKFKQEQRTIEREYYDRRWIGNTIGVFITFPTEKLYYPLKPTSVYGSKRVPAVIYVMDYVEPELYPEIKADSEINYFFQGYYIPEKDLKDFFFGQERVQDLKYTKIKINPPSKYLTQDLWMKISTPTNIKIADFINRHTFLWGLIMFIIISCLASLISALIIFKKDSPSIIRFTLFGLSNFLTLIGFSILSYLIKIDNRFTQSKKEIQPKTDFWKVIKRTLLISLIISVVFMFSFLGLLFDISFLFTLLILFIIASILLAPFVWGYYNNRKIMKFNISFTIIFLILTIITQIILSIIF